MILVNTAFEVNMKKHILLFLITLIVSSTCSYLLIANDIQTSLQQAILSNSPNEVDNAIKAGAKINFDDSLKSPLLKAILLEKFEAAKALLDAGTNPNITYLGQKLVHNLIRKGELEIATSFVNHNADFSGMIEGEQDAFTFASKFDRPITGSKKRPDFDLLFAMIQHGYNLQKNFGNKNLTNNAWYQALINGRNNHIGFFLNWGNNMQNNPYVLPTIANPNQVFTYSNGTQWTPLLILIKDLKNHTDQSGHWTTASLNTLIRSGRPDVNKKVKACKNKPEQNAISFFLLYYETLGTRPELIFDPIMKSGGNLTEGFQAFIDGGGNPDKLFKSSMPSQKFSISPLWLSLHYNDARAAKLLIEHDADINLKIDPFPIPNTRSYKKANDPQGHLRGPHTLLYFSLQQPESTIADLLMQHGAKIE